MEGLPGLVLQAGPSAERRIVEFFTAEIRNPNTRTARAATAASSSGVRPAAESGIIELLF